MHEVELLIGDGEFGAISPAFDVGQLVHGDDPDRCAWQVDGTVWGVDLNDDSQERFALLRDIMRSIQVQQMATDQLRMGLEEAVWNELLRVGEKPST